MTETQIGIRELQRDTSRIVRSVEENGDTYRISIQGHPTNVVIGSYAPPKKCGATVGEVRDSALYRSIPAELATQWLAEIEAGRDADDSPGDQW
ncbi:MAG: hypothetical protein LBI99_10120 [Propionibacteriaceae bacterium]|jgi:antitoxin (DNA-binding transcriptional repressor) of toxin-antitoxin stability system|nr:hypothetical protein [Propionibacteriaceae bacterium]